MYEKVNHLFYFADGITAKPFIDTLSWAERMVYPPLTRPLAPPSSLLQLLRIEAQMFLISAKQSKIHFLQGTFIPAYLEQMLGER